MIWDLAQNFLFSILKKNAKQTTKQWSLLCSIEKPVASKSRSVGDKRTEFSAVSQENCYNECVPKTHSRESLEPAKYYRRLLRHCKWRFFLFRDLFFLRWSPAKDSRDEIVQKGRRISKVWQDPWRRKLFKESRIFPKRTTRRVDIGPKQGSYSLHNWQRESSMHHTCYRKQSWAKIGDVQQFLQRKRFTTTVGRPQSRNQR